MEKNKVFAILAYIGILFVVPLLAARESKFAMYHTNQGLVLFLVAVISGIALTIISVILHFIPVLGWMVSGLASTALWVGIIVLMVLGILTAAKGECKPLPVIGDRFTLIK